MSAAATVQQSIATFALHALWQAPLLAGAAWCAARLGRPQARVAHVLWVATLLLCVVLPVCSTIAARHAALEAERAAAAASFSYEPSAYAGDSQPMQRVPAWKRMLHRHLNLRDGLRPFSITLSQRMAGGITLAWLLVLAFFLVQLCIGWMEVRALVRGASNEPLPHAIAAALRQQCRRLGLPVPDAKLHDGVAGPLLAGALRPMLLLPANSVNELGEGEIEAVLAHELAHLRRRDPLMHGACSLLLLPVGFHPAVLWAARYVRQTREMACDAEAAERMGSSADYAWALLQIAERTGKGHAATNLFSNGLFGAGLQLFTTRGAMEERMQMLMNENGSKVRGRAMRVAAGVSLAAAAVAAATMLQVQPTLAAERSLRQTAIPTQQVPVGPGRIAQESESILIGGEHAREQLRRAQRQLVQAESRATNVEDRRKIEGAQQALAAAQQALAAADNSPRTHLDRSTLDSLDVSLQSLKLPDTATLNAQIAVQRDAMQTLQAQMNSPEWKARMQQLQTQMEAVRVQMNSPEFKARMEEARTLDRTKIDALLADARRQQGKAMEQIRSGVFQRQMDEAARMMARAEPAPMPSPFVSPSPAAAAAAVVQPGKPLRVKPGAVKILTRVDPIYPREARLAGTQGAVQLHVLIDEKGHVEDLRVEKEEAPNESLAKAAFDAVMQWTFQPYLLNGDPIPVETTVHGELFTGSVGGIHR